MALDHRSTRMDICDLLSHSRKDDLGSQTCASLCIFDGLRRSCDESHLSCAITGWFVLRDPTTTRLRKPGRARPTHSTLTINIIHSYPEPPRNNAATIQQSSPWNRRDPGQRGFPGSLRLGGCGMVHDKDKAQPPPDNVECVRSEWPRCFVQNHPISRSIDISSLYSSPECRSVIQISMECPWKR